MWALLLLLLLLLRRRRRRRLRQQVRTHISPKYVLPPFFCFFPHPGFFFPRMRREWNPGCCFFSNGGCKFLFSSALGGKVSLSREAEYVKISWEEREERKCRRRFAGLKVRLFLCFFSKDEEDSRISKLPCFCPLFPSKKSQEGFFCLLTNPVVFFLFLKKTEGIQEFLLHSFPEQNGPKKLSLGGGGFSWSEKGGEKRRYCGKLILPAPPPLLILLGYIVGRPSLFHFVTLARTVWEKK